MTIQRRRRVAALLVIALAAGPVTEARAQVPTPAALAVSLPDLVRDVQANPSEAPQATARVVAAGRPENAGLIVGAVVGALQRPDRRALAPRIVTSAIAALPTESRIPMAPACTCSAIRAIPVVEQAAVVPAIISSAIAIAPQAWAQILACSIEAAPTLAAAITVATRSPAAVQLGAVTAPSTPLPRNSIGTDTRFDANQNCASPPCPG